MLVIASRGSQLALWQARWVQQQLAQAGEPSRIEVIQTTGDKIADVALARVGTKGLLTKEIEEDAWVQSTPRPISVLYAADARLLLRRHLEVCEVFRKRLCDLRLVPIRLDVGDIERHANNSQHIQ